MPTTYVQGYKFRFYSSDRLEPPHMHALHSGSVAKIWLQPTELAYNRGYNEVELNHILRLTQEHQAELLGAWHAHFNK